MVDLPKKKVGIVACSGEELPEGTVTRLAALKVLEHLRPSDTVTICLPLFLAGGEGDRAFARFYPTIAVDGCDRRCAARATELYSGKPAASLVVSELETENEIGKPEGRRKLNASGLQAVAITAERMAELVDALLGRQWNRRSGEFAEVEITYQPADLQPETVEATCSCGSGIPVRKLMIDGQPVSLLALPLIFKQLQEAGKQPNETTAHELLEMVKIYNPITQGSEERLNEILLREYATYCAELEHTQ
jgi:uncharacterized metal-binding protein